MVPHRFGPEREELLGFGKREKRATSAFLLDLPK
jgi:hypothetical protein